MARHADMASQAAIEDYFYELLDLTGKEAQDQARILPLLQSEFFPFRTLAERFHLIDAPTRTIYIPLGEGAELVERLRHRRRGTPAVSAAGAVWCIRLRKTLCSLE